MAQVKVWNDNTHPYSETFKGNEVKIPAKDFIEMEYYDAHEFKGTYKSIQRDGDNQPLPQSFKMIRIEEPSAEKIDAKIEENKCVACSYRGQNAKDLFDHTVTAHAAQAVVDDEAEKALKAKKKAG